MKNKPSIIVLDIATVVRKYQARWEFCFSKNKLSYHWLGIYAQRN
jgi:hypothetical protein